MDRQLSLIPGSQGELNESSFRLAHLMQEQDDAEDRFDEAKKAHKEHLVKLRMEMRVMRATIRRAQI